MSDPGWVTLILALSHNDPPLSLSLCLCISEDHRVLNFLFSESVSGHPGLPVLTSYVTQDSLFNFLNLLICKMGLMTVPIP